MPVIAALLLVVLATAVHHSRASGTGTRWPFAAAAVLAGGAFGLLLTAVVVSAIVGRDRWNGWVSGSAASAEVDLWLALVVMPAVLVTCTALVVAGVLLRARQRRLSEGAAPPG